MRAALRRFDKFFAGQIAEEISRYYITAFLAQAGKPAHLSEDLVLLFFRQASGDRQKKRMNRPPPLQIINLRSHFPISLFEARTLSSKKPDATFSSVLGRCLRGRGRRKAGHTSSL